MILYKVPKKQEENFEAALKELHAAVDVELVQDETRNRLERMSQGGPAGSTTGEELLDELQKRLWAEGQDAVDILTQKTDVFEKVQLFRNQEENARGDEEVCTLLRTVDMETDFSDCSLYNVYCD